MTATARLGPKVRIAYSFANECDEPVEAWVCRPPDGVGQRVIATELRCDRASAAAPSRATVENELTHVSVEPGGRVELEARVRPQRRSLARDRQRIGGDPELDDGARERFTRSTPMVPTNEPIRVEARRIVDEAGAKGPEAIARAFFGELATNYSYVYPPTRRGAESMLDERGGDCGEFSWLFSAWCRSVGIPARTIVGSWARGRTQAHVWSEFHLDGVGWVPLDASMGALAHQKPWTPMLMGQIPAPVDRYFGALPGPRVAFSVDPDVPLDPPFRPVAEGGEPDMEAAGRPLRWGRDTTDAGAPYMQPIYPRFPSPPDGPAKTRWKRQQPLGRWRVLPATVRGRSARALGLSGMGLLIASGVGAQVVDTAVLQYAPLAGFGAGALALAIKPWR